MWGAVGVAVGLLPNALLIPYLLSVIPPPGPDGNVDRTLVAIICVAIFIAANRALQFVGVRTNIGGHLQGPFGTGLGIGVPLGIIVGVAYYAFVIAAS